MTRLEKLDETTALLAAARAASAGACDPVFDAIDGVLRLVADEMERLDPSPVYVTLPSGEALEAWVPKAEADRLWKALSHARVH